MRSDTDDSGRINHSFRIGAADATDQSQSSTRDDEFVATGISTTTATYVKIAETTSDIAKATRVVAGIATVGAAVAAPTGLTAVGVALGITSAPFIVTAAPVLLTVAGITATVSAAAHLYSKYLRRNA